MAKHDAWTKDSPHTGPEHITISIYAGNARHRPSETKGSIDRPFKYFNCFVCDEACWQYQHQEWVLCWLCREKTEGET